MSVDFPHEKDKKEAAKDYGKMVTTSSYSIGLTVREQNALNYLCHISGLSPDKTLRQALKFYYTAVQAAAKIIKRSISDQKAFDRYDR